MALREERVRALVHGQEPRRLTASAGKRVIRHGNLIHAVAAPGTAFAAPLADRRGIARRMSRLAMWKPREPGCMFRMSSCLPLAFIRAGSA